MNQSRKKWWITGGILGGLVIIFIILFAQGYRVKNNLTVGKVGSISMTLPLSNTVVFVNESKKVTTAEENEEVSITLSPKTHRIIVSREGYFPWIKKIDIQSNTDTKLSPIFIPQSTSGVMITKSDKDYWKIRNSITSAKVPTKSSPIRSPDNSSILWLEDNAIIVGNTISSTTTKVIQPDTLIRNVDFYKDRNDVVIFSTHNGIYAVEVDKTGTQNFMPIYKGQNPDFLKMDKNSIYAKDGEVILQIVI